MSSEERSRLESERFGLGWKETESAREEMGSGTGSWKRTVRLGLLAVEVDLIDVWLEERMEERSVAA